MPLYDYKCPDHGVFQELASMEHHDKPAFCPQCKTLSARVIVLPPEVANMIRERREAMEANEKASHSPEVMTASEFHEREKEKQERRAHKYGSSCGCGSQKKRQSNLMYTAEGNKMFPSMRPWMISH